MPYAHMCMFIIKACISLTTRSPEFFYPNKFIKIKEAVQQTPANTSVSSVVFHGTHLKEVLHICQGSHAIFKGYLKQWRLLDYEDYNEEYCSYLVQPGQQPVPIDPDNDIPFGPFAWFGTKRDETDKYGPCQFEFTFASILKAYETCRHNKQHTICYRAAGTLVYKHEVCHIVMICCLEDEECQGYPLITTNNTRYFKPPKSPSDPGSSSADVVEFQTTINEYQRRHEHLSFALYLPNNRNLYLSYRDGKIRLTPHNTYCIASRSSKCVVKEIQLPMSIDKLKTLARWLSHEEQPEEGEPVVEYSGLDQSLEASFDWFSSADETENYGDQGDEYEWDSFDDYDELGFDDEQNDYHSDSSATLLYDSPASSSILAYDSDDYD